MVYSDKVGKQEQDQRTYENSAEARRVTITDSYGDSANDGITDSLVTINHEHHEVHEGDHYYIEGYAELDNGDKLNVKLVTPDSTKWSHFVWKINSSLILTTTLTEDATGGMTGGSAATIFNSNRNSSNTSTLNITSGVTDCTGGTVISQSKWGSKTGGGVDERGEEIILKQNTVYCRNFTSGSNSNIVSFKASWYEHTNKN